MSRLLAFARENGWAQLMPRMGGGALRRMRDWLTARRMHAPGFRAGRFPRLLGLRHMRVGRNFSAGDGLWLEAVVSFANERLSPLLEVGDNVSLSDYVHIACTNSVVIGSGTLIGSRIIISDHAHGVYHGAGQTSPDIPPVGRRLHSTQGVSIGRNVWLGDGVAVLAGATIGDGAIVGANAVVTGDIPAGTIAVGSPARPVRRWNPEERAWVRIQD